MAQSYSPAIRQWNWVIIPTGDRDRPGHMVPSPSRSPRRRPRSLSRSACNVVRPTPTARTIPCPACCPPTTARPSASSVPSPPARPGWLAGSGQPGRDRPSSARSYAARAHTPRSKKQDDLPGATPMATPTTRLPSISKASRRVLKNLSITQCDALCKLAGIRPVADGPASLNGTVHASAACTWARRPSRRRGSWHPT